MASSRRPLAGVIVFSAVLIAACTPVHPGSAQTSTRSSPASKPSSDRSTTIVDEAGPPPLVLEDTSPDQLAPQVHLTIGGYDPATQNLAELSIVFLHQGRWVQFVRGERLTCNGITLPGPGTSFDLKVPAETIAGKQVTCTYTSGARSATFAFTAPPMPTVLSPAAGSHISRSHSTAVRFQVGGQNTMFYITALGPTTKSWAYPWGDPPTRGTGNPPSQATLDTSALSSGLGSITLVQSFTLADIRGPGFQRIEGTGDAVHVVSVIWA